MVRKDIIVIDEPPPAKSTDIARWWQELDDWMASQGRTKGPAVIIVARLFEKPSDG